MAYPTPTDYEFDEGLDPTSVFSAPEATALLSFLRLALPNSYRGTVIVSTTTPATSGEPTGYPTDWYAWQKRCLWANPDTGELFVYVTGLGWQPITLVDGSVTTDKLADGAVTVAKIDPGNALQILRTDLAGTAVEWVDLTSVIDNDSVAPNKLQAVSGAAPAGYYVLLSTPSGGSVSWTIINATLLYNALVSGDQGTLDPQVLEGGNVGDVVGRLDTDDVDFGPLTAFLQDNSVLLQKLSISGGTASQQVRINGAGTAFEFFTPPTTPTSPNISRFVSAAAALPSAASAITTAHGLGVAPTMCQVWLVNTTTEAGYAVGDRVNADSVSVDNGSGEFDYRLAFSFSTDATNVYFQRAIETSMKIPSRDGTTLETFTPGNWNFLIEAFKFY